MDHYRQGDLLIRRVTAMPSITESTLEPILARGEVTRHAHEVIGDGAVFRDPDSQIVYIRVMSSASVTHPEHHTITLATGLYEVVRQREYTPEAVRFVAE